MKTELSYCISSCIIIQEFFFIFRHFQPNLELIFSEMVRAMIFLSHMQLQYYVRNIMPNFEILGSTVSQSIFSCAIFFMAKNLYFVPFWAMEGKLKSYSCKMTRASIFMLHTQLHYYIRKIHVKCQGSRLNNYVEHQI